MKKSISHILLFLFVVSVHSQSKIIDSLKLELNKVESDSLKGRVLGYLAHYYMYEDIDSAMAYSSKVEKLAKRTNSNYFKVLANKTRATAYLFTNKYDSSEYYFNLCFKQADSFNIGKSALYTNLGVLYKRQGRFEQALELYLEGYQYDKENGNEYGQFIKLMNISNLYNSRLNDSENFLKYSNIALEIANNTKDDSILFAYGTLLNNIGTHYYEIGDYDGAIEYFNKALKKNLEVQNTREISRNYSNIGNILSLMGSHEEAIYNLKKALEIRVSFEDKLELVETNMALGTAYGKLYNKVQSKHHFKIAMDLAKELEDLSLISETYLAISENEEHWKNHELALQNYKKHILFKDSLSQKTNLKNINELEVRYETARKDMQLAQQQLTLEQKELLIQKKQSQTKLMTGLAIALLLTSLLIWFLYQQRQKRKNQEILMLKREQQVKTLETLMEGEEKERFRIAKELHDGVNVDLSAIKYKLTSLLEKNNEVINEAVAMIDKSCEQVRAISHNLVPPALKDFTLLEALQDYCDTTNNIHEAEVSFQYIGEPISIYKKAEVNIFRIVQELVNNSIKHSGASEIDVQISHQNNNIQLTIEDNGKGFDTNAENTYGIGLQNVKSRISYLNAKLDLTSDSNGTSYVIDINTNELT